MGRLGRANYFPCFDNQEQGLLALFNSKFGLKASPIKGGENENIKENFATTDRHIIGFGHAGGLGIDRERCWPRTFRQHGGIGNESCGPYASRKRLRLLPRSQGLRCNPKWPI